MISREHCRAVTPTSHTSGYPVEQVEGSTMNPLKQLQNFGQSVYLDELGRRMISDGTLAGLIRDDGIHGVTSNPAIFEKSIAGSDDYAEAIAELAARGMTPEQVYEELVVADIQAAADL